MINSVFLKNCCSWHHSWLQNFFPVKKVQIWKIGHSGPGSKSPNLKKSDSLNKNSQIWKIPISTDNNPLIWKTSVDGMNIQMSESLNSEIRNETKTSQFTGDFRGVWESQFLKFVIFTIVFFCNFEDYILRFFRNLKSLLRSR